MEARSTVVPREVKTTTARAPIEAAMLRAAAVIWRGRERGSE